MVLTWKVDRYAELGTLLLRQGKICPVTDAKPRNPNQRAAMVVPAYNEEEFIDETLNGLPDYVTRVYAADSGHKTFLKALKMPTKLFCSLNLVSPIFHQKYFGNPEK